MAGILLVPPRTLPEKLREVDQSMPSYDYRCCACENRFVISRPMASTAEEFCPDCGSAAKRVFTPVGVAFKGSGFHNTDYRTQPAESSAPAATPPGPSPG